MFSKPNPTSTSCPERGSSSQDCTISHLAVIPSHLPKWASAPSRHIHCPPLWASAPTSPLPERSAHSFLTPMSCSEPRPRPASSVESSPQAPPSWVTFYFRLQGHLLSGCELTVVFATRFQEGLYCLFRQVMPEFPIQRTGQAG